MQPGTRRAQALHYVLLALAILVTAAVALPLWQPLLVAAVLAASLWPWQERLSARWKGRRGLAAGVLTAGIVLCVLLPLAGLVGFAAKEAISAAQFVQKTLQSSGPEGLLRHLPDPLQGWAQHGIDALPSSAGALAEKLQGPGLATVSAVGGAVSATLSGVVQTVMMLLALYFLLVSGHRLRAWLLSLSPLPPRTSRLLGALGGGSRTVLVSLVATAFVQSAVATLGYWIAHVPHPLFFGLVTLIAAFIPSVGTAIVALPLAGLVIAQGNLGWGIFLAAWALLVVGLIDNVLKPFLMKGGMQLDGAVLFFALIGGITLFGFIGLLVGPLAITLLLTVLEQGVPDDAEAALEEPGAPPRLVAAPDEPRARH